MPRLTDPLAEAERYMEGQGTFEGRTQAYRQGKGAHAGCRGGRGGLPRGAAHERGVRVRVLHEGKEQVAE